MTINDEPLFGVIAIDKIIKSGSLRIVNTDDDGAGVFEKGSPEYEGLRNEESTAKPALKRKARGSRGGDTTERKKRQKANKCEP